jgi:lipopolysaccharide export system protein LptA
MGGLLCVSTVDAEMARAPLNLFLRGLFSTALALPGLGAADQTDREKPVNIEADRLTIDDVKKESVFEGNVTVSQGTLLLRADKVVVKQDAGGFNYAYAYGKPAYFKQKRDGYEEYIEGQGERLEYDGKADKMQVFTNAEIRKGADEVKGDFIAYDAKTGFYQVMGGPSVATPVNPKGRVRATIQPPKKSTDKLGGVPGGGLPVPLKPSTSLPNNPEP